MKTQTKGLKRQKVYVDQNPVEAIRSDVWRQFFGNEINQQKEQLSGEIAPGQELDLKPEPVLPALDYHREVKTAEVRIIQENQAELQQRVAQILFELKKLVKSSQELQAEFKQVTVETLPSKAGKYHFNFLEWLKTTIRNARLKVDESRSWLSVMYQRRAKRQYWAMFKRHGTTFGLSGERVVATQTG